MALEPQRMYDVYSTWNNLDLPGLQAWANSETYIKYCMVEEDEEIETTKRLLLKPRSAWTLKEAVDAHSAINKMKDLVEDEEPSPQIAENEPSVRVCNLYSLGFDLPKALY